MTAGPALSPAELDVRNESSDPPPRHLGELALRVPSQRPRSLSALRAPRRPSLGWTVAREAVILGILLLVYQASRLLGGNDATAAFDSARAVLAVEEYLGLPAEQDLQALVTGEWLVRFANGFYLGAHLPVTGLVLLWLLVAHPHVYRRTRRTLIGATAAALAVYLLLPVAPPRMLPGFVDTAEVFGQSLYGGTGASALTNEYAAFPSLHVGWAVLVALACLAATRNPWRWLWLAYPGVTVAVVVLTGNHFWLDAAAGAALTAGAWRIAGRTRPDAGAVQVVMAHAH